MKKTNNIYVKLIDNFLSYINNLSVDDVLKLENNEINIRFEIEPVLNNNIKKTKKEDLTVSDIDLIILNLYKINNRQEGIAYLASKCSSKIDFENIVKKLDLPFQKKDNTEKLVYKIIERTIGFRLRSEAIQG